uniref:Uncharacterized protein n=1 Tax=Cyclopterus lumpus TaxID=8103 RepID=A0A8C2WJN8_CYCLU
MSESIRRKSSSRQLLQNLISVTAQRSQEDAEEVEREQRRRARETQRGEGSPSWPGPPRRNQLPRNELARNAALDEELKPRCCLVLEEDEGFSDWSHRLENRSEQEVQQDCRAGLQRPSTHRRKPRPEEEKRQEGEEKEKEKEEEEEEEGCRSQEASTRPPEKVSIDGKEVKMSYSSTVFLSHDARPLHAVGQPADRTSYLVAGTMRPRGGACRVDGAQQEAQQEMQQEMQQEVQQEAQQEVQQEAQQEVQQEAQQDVQQEAQQDVQQEMQQEVQQEAQQEVQQEVQQEAQQEVQQEVQAALQRESDEAHPRDEDDQEEEELSFTHEEEEDLHLTREEEHREEEEPRMPDKSSTESGGRRRSQEVRRGEGEEPVNYGPMSPTFKKLLVQFYPEEVNHRVSTDAKCSIIERTESLRRSGNVKKTLTPVAVSKIDKKLELYAHALQASTQEGRSGGQALTDLTSPTEPVSSKRSLFEVGEARSPNAVTPPKDADGLKVGVANLINQWVKGGDDGSRCSSPSRPAENSSGKRYKFVVTGHGKYEKVSVDWDDCSSAGQFYEDL